MGIKTEISWCDSTVNPLVGCDGCELHRAGADESHCYAAGLVGRYAGLPGWPKSFDRPEHFPGRLEKAIKWPDLAGKERPDKPWLNGYPRLIFVCDLSDPFTESIDPESWLTPALPAIADSPHVYLLLTKRGCRMLDYWQRHAIPHNVWQGVSVTGDANLFGRVSALLRAPGISVRFVSYEPAIGPISMLSPWLLALESRINWLICGGESGPGARPMHPDWARSVRDQCLSAGVPFFFKQWGAYLPDSQNANMTPEGRGLAEGTGCAIRVGKKRAGDLLDGREWKQMPEVKR